MKWKGAFYIHRTPHSFSLFFSHMHSEPPAPSFGFSTPTRLEIPVVYGVLHCLLPAATEFRTGVAAKGRTPALPGREARHLPNPCGVPSVGHPFNLPTFMCVCVSRAPKIQRNLIPTACLKLRCFHLPTFGDQNTANTVYRKRTLSGSQWDRVRAVERYINKGLGPGRRRKPSGRQQCNEFFPS